MRTVNSDVRSENGAEIRDNGVIRVLARRQPTLLRAVALLTVLCHLGWLATASATDFYWDANGGTSGTGGSGTWNAGSTLWRNGSATGTLSVWPNTNPNADTARLAGTAGTVTLHNSTTVNINVNQIIFGVTGYTIAPNASGTAKLNLSGTTPTIDASTGTSTISAQIIGSAGLQRIGSGTLTLSGDNSGLSGGITSGGTGILRLEHGSAAGTGTITLQSVNTGTADTFTLAGGITVANAIDINASTGRNNIKSISGNNTLSGNINITGSGTVVVLYSGAAAGTTFTVGGATPNSATISATATISLRGTTASTDRYGILNSQVTSTAGVTAELGGIWTINSTGNSWTTSQIATGGSFKLGAHDALATGAQITVTQTATGYVDLNGFNQTVAGLNGTPTSGTATIANHSTTSDSILTLAGLSEDKNFGFAISDGTGGRKTSLVMDNATAFIQTLSGGNTYTGTTTIDQGTLRVNGSTAASSAVTVNGGVLGGTGTIGGAVDVVTGTLAPGASIESLSTGALSLQSASTYAYEMDNDALPGVAGDLTVVNGTLDIASGATLTLAELGAGSWALGEKLTLINYSGSWNSGVFTYGGNPLGNGAEFTFSGMPWQIKYNDTGAGSNFTGDLTGSSYVTLTAVPEPGSMGLLLFAFAGALTVRRRKQRALA